MKNVKLISLTLSMLISFVINAQEKPVSKERSENIPLENKTITPTYAKSKDTISDVKVSSNFVQPATSTNRIVICAPSKISLTKEPLYILDGAVINSKQFSKVNPNDIENIKVLKGIDATALYGNHAINGVIIITTKNDE